MDKRYQVFVSSTYADLKSEREQVIRTLMEMDCIPAGMELFPATDEEQWRFIQKIIDDCDYYLLIIGGRYGSLTAEGISYTEKEFDYALEKGMKIVALVHNAPGSIPLEKSEASPELRAKLDAFRIKVQDGRLVRFWQRSDDLPGLVALSLAKTIKMYPAVGWIRANHAANEQVLADQNSLLKEREELRAQLKALKAQPATAIKDIADLDSPYVIRVSFLRDSVSGRGGKVRTYTDVSPTWRDIFSMIAPYLQARPNESTIGIKLQRSLFKLSGHKGESPTIDEQELKTIGIQLRAYGLVDIRNLQTTEGGTALFWLPTEKGDSLMFQTRVIRAIDQSSPEPEGA